MNIDKTSLDELKQKYGAIYEGAISFTGAGDNQHDVEFIFREPKTIDVEAYSKSAQTLGVITGNLNLIQSLVVYPAPKPVIDEIRDYPNAFGKFIEAVIQPFFRNERGGSQKETVNSLTRLRLFIRRFLGEDVSGLPVSR